MYIKCIYVYNVQYTLSEQSITVTIIDDDNCPFFWSFSPFFFFLSWFPVDELCCRSLKREEGDSCDSSHSFISGVCENENEKF